MCNERRQVRAVHVNLTPLASRGVLEAAVFNLLVIAPSHARYPGSNPARSGPSRTGYTGIINTENILSLC